MKYLELVLSSIEGILSKFLVMPHLKLLSNAEEKMGKMLPDASRYILTVATKPFINKLHKFQ